MTLFYRRRDRRQPRQTPSSDSLTAGMLSLMSFLLVAAPLKDGQISTRLLLRSGIFTAILVAIYSTEPYAFLKRHNITIRLPPEVPAGVARPRSRS